MDIFAFITLGGGLAMFLFGMDLMGAGLKGSSAGTLKTILSKITGNTFTGFLFGLLITAIIQSSTATIVICVGLLGAGILNLKQTICIAMGANVGTTITAQIIRLLDVQGSSSVLFKLFTPDTLAPVALIVGIILGMLYANSLRNHLPETWVPGIKFCTKQILRAGIVLYGFRLTLTEVAAVGLPAVIIDTIIVAGTIFLGIWLGRAMKMDKDTSLMTATGSAICGAAAVLGAEPVVKCEGHKTAIAVSTVVIFGTISMFLYPIMYRAGMLNGLGDMGVAIYTGSTLHEVAHVAGAGNAMDPTDALGIAGTATITKMIRVMMLAPVLVIMSFALAKRKSSTNGGKAEKSKITIPWFAFGFIGIICLNSLLQYILGVDSVKEIPLNGAIEYIDTFMLTMAMTALGTDTSIEKFKQAGAKPFLLAGLLYIWLVGGGYLLTKYLVPAFM